MADDGRDGICCSRATSSMVLERLRPESTQRAHPRRWHLRRSILRGGYQVAKAVARTAGLDLTRRSFYSPIPSHVPDAVFAQASCMHGIKLDLAAQLAFIRERLAPFMNEFQPPVSIDGSYTFIYDNGSFGHGDADILYGMIRSLTPSRIIEIGSGHSSAVIRYAAARNAAEGHEPAYSVYDPFITDKLADSSLAFTNANAVRAEDLDESVFRVLKAGDILFIDSTHTVRLGGDVVHLILELLPIVAPGVMVHFHDIFLPYSYPRSFYEREFYWAEQYLLQAFLAFNVEYEPLIALHALARLKAAEIEHLIPAVRGQSPVSFWLQRRHL